GRGGYRSKPWPSFSLRASAILPTSALSDRGRVFGRHSTDLSSSCLKAPPGTVDHMVIGVPGEVKEGENRVALTPDGTRELSSHGHTVLVEKGAGQGSAIHDREYRTAGAHIVTGD